MNKFVKVTLATILSFAFCSQSMAAFVLNGTRFIYEEGKRILPSLCQTKLIKLMVDRSGLIIPTRVMGFIWYHSHLSLRWEQNKNR